jgi:predicted 3-demethylubiquinone-9 3-methyltransferase (glyoxalase superfamily)
MQAGSRMGWRGRCAGEVWRGPNLDCLDYCRGVGGEFDRCAGRAVPSTGEAQQKTDGAFELLFELVDNRIIVQAQVNEEGPIRLLLDMGADEGFLTSDSARRLHSAAAEVPGDRLIVGDLLSATMPAMNKLAPFLWFNDNAEEAAEFYLAVFPHARKLDELRSKGVGPWPVGKIATITIELEGQEMVFLNGGPAHQLNAAFSFFVRCDSQEEIDSYWDKLIEGGKPMACGWLTDRFGLCWQIVPRNIGDLISHPKAMEAMMGMIKMDLSALEAAARES